ncbi:MAG: outer membrane protein assembly factor BamD [Chitinophagaceae bacterium]|nr:outer membrane protein assembly factor BamD [Chitinophagaceae bacterium]
MKILFGLFISVLLVSCSSKFEKILKSTDYEFKLKKADELYANKKYKQAEELYLELFPVFKGTDKFEDLYYKFAYASYYQHNYEESENNFKGFLEVFPNSPKADEIAFLHAYTFYLQSPKVELDQTNTLKAIGMMQTFINTHPGSLKIKEANDVIDKCRAKLESKEYRSAALYYKLQQYRAAGLGFSNLLFNYPESASGEEYKLMSIKSYYEFARLSVPDKQEERYEKVTTEYNDFTDRYPDSKLLKEAESYSNQSINHIKEIKNEQIKTPAER